MLERERGPRGSLNGLCELEAMSAEATDGTDDKDVVAIPGGEKGRKSFFIRYTLWVEQVDNL